MPAPSHAPFNNDGPAHISGEKTPGCFPLSASGRSAPLCVCAGDFPGVHRVAQFLRDDIGRVTGAEPELLMDALPSGREIVLIGTLGRNPLIDRMAYAGAFDAADLEGKRETFVRQEVRSPAPDVDRALVIAGSDKRGTLYGMLDLSQRIGVSPWHWWADVPVHRRPELYVRPERHTLGEPAVAYRGIFINDESPSLDKRAHEQFSGFNHRFNEKVFELILRLRGNFLWPAMWGRAFFDDDPANPDSADLFGIVIGTSHHEPMMRAHAEWGRYGTGAWNYAENETVLRNFWEKGIRGMDGREWIVTLGMRGDGDMPLTAETNIALLERIIADQREIIARLTGKDPAAVPQAWALYKEVQAYYDMGMQVPEDVTLLLCDDNWGNVRRLPDPGSGKRAGGYGMYYHYDYVGGPRNYKWLNASPIARTWEQMHLAYRHGVDRIWIVNVGDIKPLEFPIQFFLDYAWNPGALAADSLLAYTREWAAQQFGGEHAAEIAHILAQYTRFNSRRKPEMLSPDTYSLVHYREAETVVEEFDRLVAEAGRIQETLPVEYRDAFYQLVFHPVQACANLNELYVTAGRNQWYAGQGRAATNGLAAKVRDLFERDAEITRRYNRQLGGGKWNHMMDQTHIGYTTWQQPEENVMPEVAEIELPDPAEMGVAVEGSEDWWPRSDAQAALPEFDVYRKRPSFIEVFNRGKQPFEFQAESEEPWLTVTPGRGMVQTEIRLAVDVDWAKAPKGKRTALIHISGPHGVRVVVKAAVRHPARPKRDGVEGFVEGGGCVSMEAEHFQQAVGTDSIRWQCIPAFGRTLSGMTPFPVTATPQTPGGDSPRLEYRMHLFHSGKVRVRAYCSPTLDFLNRKALRYAVSFDGEAPQVVDLWPDNSLRAWEQAVGENIKTAESEHAIPAAGGHILRFWMVDPGVVLQKIVVDTGGVQPSYLGPPESYYRAVNTPE